MATRTVTTPWLSIDEAAAYCKLSRRSLEHLLDTGRIAVTRPTARRILIHREQLDAYLRTRTTGETLCGQ